MKKILTSLIILTLIIIVVTACSQNREEQFESAGTSTVPIESENSTEGEPPPPYLPIISADYRRQSAVTAQMGAAEITVWPADDQFLGQFSNYHEFLDIHADRPHRAHDIIISTNIPLRNFRISEMEFTASDHNEPQGFYAGDTLFNQYFLTPQRPIVIRGIGWSNIPTRAHSFTDNNGAIIYFTISRSGYDGSFVITEIENRQPD